MPTSQKPRGGSRWRRRYIVSRGRHITRLPQGPSTRRSTGRVEAEVIVRVLLAAVSLGMSPALVEDDAGKLRWMAGCWESRSGSRLIEERWTPPPGGLMLGVSRTSRNDSIVEFEQ